LKFTKIDIFRFLDPNFEQINLLKSILQQPVPEKIYLKNYQPFEIKNKDTYQNSISMHKPLNIDWLLKNDFITLTDSPLFESWTFIDEPFRGSRQIAAFIGQHTNQEGLASGFMRCIDEEGIIYEGTFNHLC